jgi:hypothetical protein
VLFTTTPFLHHFITVPTKSNFHQSLLCPIQPITTVPWQSPQFKSTVPKSITQTPNPLLLLMNHPLLDPRSISDRRQCARPAPHSHRRCPHCYHHRSTRPHLSSAIIAQAAPCFLISAQTGASPSLASLRTAAPPYKPRRRRSTISDHQGLTTTPPSRIIPAAVAGVPNPRRSLPKPARGHPIIAVAHRQHGR